MKPFHLISHRSVAVVALALICAGCAVPQDQFGYAVKTGNLSLAQATVGPNFANMRVYQTPRQYSVPMQFAIVRHDTRMADFLLAHGAHRTLDGENLAYYSALNGQPGMAKFFASRGIGSTADIGRASSAIAANQRDQARQNKQGAQLAGWVALGVVAALANSGGGDSTRNSGGFTESETRQQDADEYHYWKDQYGSGD